MQDSAQAQRYRLLRGVTRWVFLSFTAVASIAAVTYSFRVPFFGYDFDEMGYLYFLLALYLPLVFLVFPRKTGDTKGIPLRDYMLALVTFIISLYFFINSRRILTSGWEVAAPLLGKIFALMLVASVIEGARRTAGLSFACIATVFALYPLFAASMPSFLHGKSLGFWRTISYHALGPESIVGLPLNTVGTLLVSFIIFGVTLSHTGAGKFFLDIALALCGHVRGGAAKVSIISSALFGSISGSAVSNVITTGSFTIPAMKKSGYPSHYAGAVEACASTGGVLMPPIMGATAFIMAQYLNVPYFSIAKAAFIPACLYYLGIYVQVDGMAAKLGLRGLDRAECPSVKHVLKEGWYHIMCLGLLIYFAVFLWRESQAAWAASAIALLLAQLRKGTRFTWQKVLAFVEDVGKTLSELTAILSAVGIIIGSLAVTGVSHSLASEIVALAGDNVLLLLVLGALTSLILGTGMTISACYIFLAVIMAPALVSKGFDPLAVHLYVLYWGMISFITPPVCLASFTAASVAGSSPIKTGLTAMRLATVIYLLPFYFVYNPALLIRGPASAVLQALGTAVVGVWILASALEGYLVRLGRVPMWARPLLIAAGGMLALPEPVTDLAGAGIAAVTIAVIRVFGRGKKQAVPSRDASIVRRG